MSQSLEQFLTRPTDGTLLIFQMAKLIFHVAKMPQLFALTSLREIRDQGTLPPPLPFSLLLGQKGLDSLWNGLKYREFESQFDIESF